MYKILRFRNEGWYLTEELSLPDLKLAILINNIKLDQISCNGNDTIMMPTRLAYGSEICYQLAPVIRPVMILDDDDRILTVETIKELISKVEESKPCFCFTSKYMRRSGGNCWRGSSTHYIRNKRLALDGGVRTKLIQFEPWDDEKLMTTRKRTWKDKKVHKQWMKHKKCKNERVSLGKLYIDPDEYIYEPNQFEFDDENLPS